LALFFDEYPLNRQSRPVTLSAGRSLSRR